MKLQLFMDLVGITGVGLIVFSYFLLQAGRLNNTDMRYSLANAFGALFIILSILSSFNLSAFLIEVFWLAISIYGLLKNSFFIKTGDSG
jgi:hypothetical protein